MVKFPSVGGRRRSHRRQLVLVSVLVASALAIAAPASGKSTSQVRSWGSNERGQLGVEKGGRSQDKPVAVPGVSGTVVGIAAGGTTSSVLLSDGTVVEWGDYSSTPAAVSGLSDVTALAEGGALALLANGTVMQWAPGESPAAVSGLNHVTAVAAGGGFWLALLSDRTVMAWGQNRFGQLGDGTQEYSATPVPVTGLSEVKSISAGLFHAAALLDDGEVMAWGENGVGELGDGNTALSDVPVPVCAVGTEGSCPLGPYLSDVTAISASNSNDTLARLANGTAVAWGRNDAGELGNGPPQQPTVSDVPVVVTGLSNVKALAAGDSHSLALLSNGTVMSWGWNGYGMLGLGEHTGPEKCDVEFGGGGFPCSTAPVAVSALSGIAGIAGGGEHSLAYLSPIPSVTKVGPKQGSAAGGKAVTITGTLFTGATSVRFGTEEAEAINVASATSITAVSPPEPPGTVDVTVTTPSGTSAISSKDHFTFK